MLTWVLVIAAKSIYIGPSTVAGCASVSWQTSMEIGEQWGVLKPLRDKTWRRVTAGGGGRERRVTMEFVRLIFMIRLALPTKPLSHSAIYPAVTESKKSCKAR